MNTPDAFVADPWLTGVLGRPCYRLAAGTAALPDLLSHLPGTAFVYAKRPVDDLTGCAALTDAGFRLVDTNLTFLGRPVPDSAEGPVRFARPTDRDAVAAVAERAFACSRFHLDPQIDTRLADRTRSGWAANYFRGSRGDAMVVAVENDVPVGFLQLLRQDETLVIDLIGVAAEARGRGLGRSMVAFACSRLPVETLKVGTQAANTGSVRFYENLGLRLSEAAYMFHWHGSGTP